MISNKDMKDGLREAVRHFWRTRLGQAKTQKDRGTGDRGARGAVTGGAQMDGFVDLVARIIREAGVSNTSIYRKQNLTLPGYFRATKEWDLVAVSEGTLIAVIETKSQVGSFGNNFNNRTEESIGSAADLWTAFREGAFSVSSRPWLGYLFLLEDCPKSRAPVKVREPHFPVFKEFRGSSYGKRYELLLRRLVRERHYESASFLISDAVNGLDGDFQEPAEDLTFSTFAQSLSANAAAYAALKSKR